MAGIVETKYKSDTPKVYPHEHTKDRDQRSPEGGEVSVK